MTNYTQGVPPLADPTPDTATFLQCQYRSLGAVPGQAGVASVPPLKLSVKRWNGTAWVKQ